MKMKKIKTGGGKGESQRLSVCFFVSPGQGNMGLGPRFGNRVGPIRSGP